MQVRFGIVLLVIVSIVSFMLGRSMKPFIEERRHQTAALESPGGAEEAASAGKGSHLAGADHESGCVNCHLDAALLKETASVEKKTGSALQSGAG